MEKYKNLFDTTHLQSDIKKRSLRSGAVTISAQGIMFVLQLGSTMILARILSPQDYGINAMAVTISGFASMFSSLGLSTATVQRADINHEQVSTLFWINAAIGLLLTLIVAAISPAAAWFYQTPEMLWVMLSLSVTFTISGLSVQHSALLTRQMKFYSLAKISVLSSLAGIVVAIIAGYYGFGYWALVFNSLTNSIVGTFGFWIACKWIPGKPSRSAGVGSMIKFGSDLVGFNVINYFARNLDNVLIGRYHGSGALGLYSKAYQLLMMPITNLRNPMTSVAMPALSRMQNDPEQYLNYYMKFVSILSFLSMPLVVFMGVCSDKIISLLLGPQWLGASELFKILAFVAFIQPVVSTQGLVMITTGKSRRYFVLGVIGATITSISFVLGLPWGAKGVAIAFVISTFLKIFPMLYAAFKDTPVQIKHFLLSIYKPFTASLIVGIACYVIINFDLLSAYQDVIILIITFSFSILIYLISIIIISGGPKDLIEYYNFMRLAFGKR
ncbi:MAG: lipopolysaccharide biosynthesis protein [Bacteroidales bacterium]|nr:lipopolysaccharide biosynthesis protein [Bacteroidales bacterium]